MHRSKDYLNQLDLKTKRLNGVTRTKMTIAPIEKKKDIQTKQQSRTINNQGGYALETSQSV